MPSGKLTRAEGADLIQRKRALHRPLVNGVTVEYPRPQARSAGRQARATDFDVLEKQRLSEWGVGTSLYKTMRRIVADANATISDTDAVQLCALMVAQGGEVCVCGFRCAWQANVRFNNRLQRRQARRRRWKWRMANPLEARQRFTVATVFIC